MLFSVIDCINLLALFTGMIGSFMMYYFSPEVSSQTILYRKEEFTQIKKRDDRKNKMIRRGMLLLFISFILQASAIFYSVATKK